MGWHGEPEKNDRSWLVAIVAGPAATLIIFSLWAWLA